jgi:hypothetical protein
LVLFEESGPELFEIGLDGSARSRGHYQGSTAVLLEDTMRVLPDGSLVGIAYGTRDDAGVVGPDTIERLSLDAPPVVLYDETGKRVEIHISDLVTGP